MSKRKWHTGPPPHIGWWNASTGQYIDIWRWWNGKYWSKPVSTVIDYKISAKELNRRARIRAGVFDYQIQWSDYWPRNAVIERPKL